MNVSRQDLRRRLLAVGQQARATAEEEGSPYTHERFYKQFNSIAQALQDRSSAEIPLLPVSTPYLLSTLRSAIDFAVTAAEVESAEEVGVQQAHEHGVSARTTRPTQERKPEGATPGAGMPCVFIGCSQEGLKYAQLIQLGLEGKALAIPWTQGAFELSKGTLETLVEQKDKYDYAILILTPDDVLQKGAKLGKAARDNVIFELGLFMGALGRERVFMVVQKGVDLPTDLAGITVDYFPLTRDSNQRAALGPAVTRLLEAMKLL